ncbi:ribosomal-protein-alanine N-acetyltransferase [Stigmatella aurantiaca]|uniref:Ribosomal-protein-alanine N-acetyltransferase n=1 Tax=Stigmatella aurantiaca TaxID=41 RepID=A0A1H7MJR6_STIAU|nr:GNAT family N-acetyltransferase [Stigmatella aurantiaca]SEL11319.1 ribosomal-protein-alanine N-acetyltransferase [Stigmatella aurantiaca]
MDFYETLEREGTGQWWKIISRQSPEALGAIGYNHYQAQHKKAESGYWLLPRFWNQGILTERDCEIKDGHPISLRIYSLLSTDPAGSKF